VLLDGDEYGDSLDVKGRGRRFGDRVRLLPGPGTLRWRSWNVEFDSLESP
jgi:hypothetical protein